MDSIIDSGTLQLIIVWAIGVVAFFALWAILTKVVQRISRKKEAEKSAEANANEPKRLQLPIFCNFALSTKI